MRDAKRCDACGIMGPGWARVVLTREGQTVRSFVLCLACASDVETLMRKARHAA